MRFSVFTDFLELFFPETCEVCGESLRYSEKIICTNCLSDIPRVYIHNKEHNPLEDLLWGQIPYTKATSFFNYTKKNPYAVLLHNLKYKNQQNIGVFLGEMFAVELQNSGFLEGIDAIVPVPLHKKREHKRGYNQSSAIAKGIANISKIEVLENIVIRKINTKTQTTKSKEERKQNVANIFEVTNQEILKDKHVLLLDDVITTGATCISCAEAILEQGFIKNISIASIGLARN